MVLFQNVVALAEAVTLARKAGLSPQRLFETLATGSADSFALRNHGMKALLRDEFPERAYSVEYALKDLGYALDLAKERHWNFAAPRTRARARAGEERRPRRQVLPGPRQDARFVSRAREVLRSVGAQEAPVEIFGDDPVLPVRYRIAAAASAALGALGIAVTSLAGKAQRIRVNARAAAISLRSARYLKIDGKSLPSPWDPLSGFYPVRDGWVSIHCNFPNHRDAAMRVLGTPAERERARRQAARGTAWLSRTPSTRRADAPATCAARSNGAGTRRRQAIASQPLVEIARIGDAPPEPRRAARPLGGVRVLDLTRVLAGPTCGKSLAEHGADVLKISAAHLPDSGLVELDTGIGKRSARLDLRSEPEVLRNLVREADVFIQSYRPGRSPRGLRSGGRRRVAARHRVRLAQRVGRYGSVARAARIRQHRPGGKRYDAGKAKPRLLPVSAIDYVSGYLMAFGVCVALARRASIGGSWLVRVALARVGKWIVDLGLVPAYAAIRKSCPKPSSSH